MGYDSHSLPDRVKVLIEPSERHDLGLETTSEMHERLVRRLERDEQTTLVNWLHLREEDGDLVYDWSRTDRKTTNRNGMPDFRLYAKNRTLLGEMKVAAGKLSPEQVEMLEKFQRAGTEVQLWRSSLEGIEKIRNWLSALES
jgi:hypothetical protein